MDFITNLNIFLTREHIPCEIQSVAIVISLTVWAIMVVVAMVAGIMVLSVVTKVLAWDVAIMNMEVVVEVLVINMLGDAEIVVMGVIAIALYAADVPSDALADAMLVGLPGIDAEVFVDANTNAFAVATVLEFPVSIRLEGFNC